MGNMLDKKDNSSYTTSIGREIVKGEQYKWASPSSPGVFMMIKKGDLNIDDSYQRDAKRKRVIRIARNWDWRLFGAILVVVRKDGSLWVVDGGHRTRASFYRKDITELPCMVFEASAEGQVALQSEARTFIDKGVMRSSIDSCSRFHAGVTAGSEIDLKANEIVKKSGYQVSNSAKSSTYRFSSIVALKNVISIDEPLAARTFALCAEMADGINIQKSVLDGIFFCAQRMQEKNVDILSGAYLGTIRRAGLKGIARFIRDAQFEAGKGGVIISSRAVLNLLNYKKRNRLTWE